MQVAAERFASADPNARLAAAVLRTLFGEAYARDFNIALWEGTYVPASRQARFTLRVNAPGALRSAFTPPADLNAGRAFAAGLLDVDGDIEAAVDELFDFVQRPPALTLVKLAMLLRRMPRAHLPQLRDCLLYTSRTQVDRALFDHEKARGRSGPCIDVDRQAPQRRRSRAVRLMPA